MFLLNRRRFIGIAATVAGAGALAAAARQPFVWRGTALGADAELRLYHRDHAFARALTERVLAEVSRLEGIFSLYRDDSQISRLNRDAYLARPAAELLEVLALSRYVHGLSGGVFDPSVQAWWRLYADRADAPSAAETARARAAVDFAKVRFDSRAVRLARGMSLTLNGIAQGYITDRVTALLRQAGLAHAVVNMGEIRRLAPAGAGAVQAAVRDPQHETRTLLRLPLHNHALATSSAYGTRLPGGGSHLFDPRQGAVAPSCRSVSVMARQAALADALSTALAAGGETLARQMAARLPETGIWLVRRDGTMFQAA